MAEASGQPFTLMFQRLSDLPAGRKIGLMVAFAAVVAIIAGALLWAQTPDYRILYGNLSDRDGGSVVEALQKLNIPFKMAEGGGAIMVPSGMVYEARLKLASQGLPKGGTVGFDLMDNMKLGATQFQENITYQRALEGEIARTIEALSSVQGARVHLAIPKESVFVREQQKPSASVLVSLYPGRILEKAQVEGIVHMVAGSVPEMPTSNVTIIDQNSNLLTSSNKPGLTGLDSSQLEYLHEVEQTYIRRIEDILVPITGLKNVRAQVTAELDFAVTEQTAETYKPNQTPNNATVRSSQTSETLGDGAASAAGVPGALSNQPPGSASAPLNGAAGAKPANGASASSAGGSVHKEATTNFEVDKTISHVRSQVGAVKRLSVAVVVNNKGEKDKKGKVTSRALSKDEVSQIYNLAKEAMGFNQARGDTLNVVNAPFSLSEEEALPAAPIWKDPAMVALAKDIVKYLIIAGVLFYLIVGVIRPALEDLTKASPKDDAVETNRDGDEVVHLSDSFMKRNYQDDLNAAKESAKSDPKLIASVMKDWVAKE